MREEEREREEGRKHLKGIYHGGRSSRESEMAPKRLDFDKLETQIVRVSMKFIVTLSEDIKFHLICIYEFMRYFAPVCSPPLIQMCTDNRENKAVVAAKVNSITY